MATIARPVKPRLFLTGGWYVLGLLLFAIPAFWPIYITKLPFDAEFWVNMHAVGVTAWMLMLISQPLLIRASKRPLHRKIGKFSYFLVPFIVVTSILLAHSRASALSEADFQLLGRTYYLALIANVLFVTCYSLAIVNRRNMFLHSRYMIATALPLIDPVTFRLLLFYSPLPPSDLLFPAIGYGLTDAILLLLIWLDRNEHRERQAFLRLLPIFVIGHLGWFTIGQTDWWLGTVAAFRDLPIT